MDQTFIILFSGLYALLSGSPGNPQAPEAHVLLVDAKSNACLHLPKHSPVLTVRTEDVLPKSAPADVTVVLPDGVAYSVWRLDHQIVTISGSLGGDQRLTEIRNTRVPGSVSPKPNTPETTDLSWVTRMSDLGVNPTLDEAVFNDPGHSALAARVELHRGTLSTHNVVVAEKNLPLTFNFKKGGILTNPQILVQALADVVRYEVPTSNPDEVTLTLSSWAKGAAPRTVRLHSKHGNLVATVSNQPLDPHSVPHDDRVITHYSAFYELLRKPRPAERDRPLPISDIKLLQNAHCAPGGFP